MAKEPKIRKIVTSCTEVLSEGGKDLERPIKKVAVMAVIENPFAGKYQEDLSELSEIGEYLGTFLAKKGAEILGADKVESYGKGCIVGENGELEHSSAILHPKLGKPFRAEIGGGKAIIPSAEKVAGIGATLDVPIGFKDASFVRSHYDAVEVYLPDAPKANEILVSLCMSDGGRPHPRIGGLTKDEAKCEDGLR
ncbi:MAG: amino acid synthesis family protein [Lachnospiraceae bacterium]|nr:amino acid synthesis family protein [Lachnospiraceae bacterium]